MIDLSNKEIKLLVEALDGFASFEENCAGCVDQRFLVIRKKLAAYLVSTDDSWTICKGCGEEMEKGGKYHGCCSANCARDAY